jgi:hypothetical protein
VRMLGEDVQAMALRNAYAIDMLAPDPLTRRRERIAGIHGLSIDTIELYERNMIDELALRLVDKREASMTSAGSGPRQAHGNHPRAVPIAESPGRPPERICIADQSKVGSQSASYQRGRDQATQSGRGSLAFVQ